MTSHNVRPSIYSSTMPTFSSAPRNAQTFRCLLTVVYTRSSARNCTLTSRRLLCISPLISICTILGFFTTHLKSSEALPVANGKRFSVGCGGAEYDVGVGNEKMEEGCDGGWKMDVTAADACGVSEVLWYGWAVERCVYAGRCIYDPLPEYSRSRGGCLYSPNPAIAWS